MDAITESAETPENLPRDRTIELLFTCCWSRTSNAELDVSIETYCNLLESKLTVACTESIVVPGLIRSVSVTLDPRLTLVLAGEKYMLPVAAKATSRNEASPPNRTVSARTMIEVVFMDGRFILVFV